MSSVLIFIISFIGLIVAPVTSQQDIISVKTIEDGSPFTITCNPQRVITSSSANLSTIHSLQIYILNNAAQENMLVAQYSIFAPPTDKKEIQKPPQGRNWNFNFSGSNSENGGLNNQAMKIEIVVFDSKCDDAGLYNCTMIYYGQGGILTTVSNKQNVTSTAKTTEPFITLEPIFEAPKGISNTSTYDLGANVTVKCRFEGPEQLDIKWKRERRPAIGLDIQYDDYTIANDITTDPPEMVAGTSATCPSFSHQSVLRLTISKDDADRHYLCVVLSGEEEKASSAAFIQVRSDTAGPGVPGSVSNPEPATANNTPIGLIVGVVVGVGVAIIIVVIIVVVCYRRRSKGDNKNKDVTDSRDGGDNFHPPPPAMYSRPQKVINNNNSRDSKIPTGMVNEGLNHSYDSRDSGHKGPPVYAITNKREPYQGRQNNAFDSEDKNYSRQPQESEPQYYNSEPRPPVGRYSRDNNSDVHRDYYEDANFGTGV